MNGFSFQKRVPTRPLPLNPLAFPGQDSSLQWWLLFFYWNLFRIELFVWLVYFGVFLCGWVFCFYFVCLGLLFVLFCFVFLTCSTRPFPPRNTRPFLSLIWGKKSPPRLSMRDADDEQWHKVCTFYFAASSQQCPPVPPKLLSGSGCATWVCLRQRKRRRGFGLKDFWIALNVRWTTNRKIPACYLFETPCRV